jgi:radical SAM superfamily enzyme YgiQ (UPF0313 family)
MAKVLFIYPSLNAQEGFNHGIAALSGTLKAMGAETRLLLLNEGLYGPLSLEELGNKVMEFDPHLVCFSVMSQQYKYALEIARYLKERFPYPLAVGGVHATMVPEEVAGDDVFDFIGMGECDHALAKLVQALEHDLDTRNLPNIWVKTERGYARNALGDFPDLEALPPKDYEVFDLDHMIPYMNGWMSIITSRGCPYRCSYCFNHQIVARYRKEAGVKPSAYLRRYPVPRIMSEMKTLTERHPDIRVFIFDDDLFTLKEDYVLRFCEAYRDAGINRPFVVNAHVQSFSRTMARALKEAGCMILKFGVESGSERIRRKVLKREMSDQAIHKAFETAHEEGLHTSAFIMIGLPLEEQEDLEATIDMMASLKPGRFRWATFYPFPGTDIHRLCEQEGLLDHKKMESLDNFYEASALRLPPDMDLRLRKLQRAMPWYVNARSSFACAPLYQEKVGGIEAMSAEDWNEASRDFLERDRNLSEKLAGEGQLHYSIRFTQVMAVRSDYREDGDFLAKPAKEWKSKALGPP